MNNFKLNADAFDLGTSNKIKINLENLPDDIKIVDAVLSVKVESVTTNSGIPVHYSPIGSSSSSESWNNVDNVILSANDILKINISDELQDALLKEATHLQLDFETPNIVFAIDSESDFINIDYISLAEFQNNGSSHKINLGKSGQASVDLVTGRLAVSTPLVNTDSNVLPLSISANYHSVENKKIPNDTGLPKNWHLNVNQFLIKENDPDGDLRFTYIDENGKNQIIEEKYSYIDDNGEKKYAERKFDFDSEKENETILAVDLDGNYIAKQKTTINSIVSYKEFPVTTELVAPSGLKLVSSLSNIKGSHLVDYEPEELINIRKQLNQLNLQIDDLKKTRQLNNEQLLVMILTKELIEKQHNSVENKINQNKDFLTLKEKIEKIRMIINQKNRSFHDRDNLSNSNTLSYATTYLTGKNYDYKRISEIYDYYLNQKDFLVGNGVNDWMHPSDVRAVADILTNESNDVYSLGITNPLNIEEYVANNTYESSSNAFQGTIALEKENCQIEEEIYTSPIELSTFNTKVEDTIKAIAGNEIQLNNKIVGDEDLLDSYIAELSSDYFIDTATAYNNISNNRNITLSLKDLLTIELQIKSIVNSNLSYQSQEAECLETKQKLEHQLELYEEQVPVHYLYNDSNVIFGFGKTYDEDTFRLVLITDTYENTINIAYESLTSNKIKSIADSSDKIISFVYDESIGYLKNIIDSRERKTSFIYEGTLLKEIIRNSKQTLFAYSNDNKLLGILSPAGSGAKFTYTNNQVIEIQALSIVDSIEHKNYKLNPNYNEKLNNFLDCLVPDSKVNFVYNNYESTTITNSKNKSLTYIFDKYGKVCRTYETGYIDNTTEVNLEDFYSKVNEFIYEDDKVTFKATDLPNSINYLEDIRCSFTAVQQKEALSLGSLTCGLDCIPYNYPVYADYYRMPHQGSAQYKIIIDGDNNNTILTKLNADTNELLQEINSKELSIGCNHRTLMLSTWAKADSAFIITKDNNETETYPAYITNRKFELRAVIYYKNETTPDTESAQFDWRNTGWQYIALPLSLKLKEIVKIEFILDYSNNTNTIDFTDLELKLGDFEKTKYNTDGLPESKENGHSKWITSYQYDKNSNVIKQTLTNKFDDEEIFDAYFEYNKQGKLIKTTNFNNIIEETVYNDKGSVVKTLTYHKDEPANIICEETILDDKGKQPYAVNEFGEKLYDYEYIEGTGITSSTIDTKDVKTSYGYDNHDTLLQTTTSIKGEENTNIYGYTLDMLTSLTHNNFNVKYTYDNKGRKTKINIADKTYLEKVYGENEEITFYKLSENENLYDVYKHTYDYNGNLLDVYYKHNIIVEDKSQISFEGDTPILQNVYNIYGNLVYTKDFTNGEVSHTYSFDDFGQVENQTTTLTDATVVVDNKYESDHSTLKSCTITISSENNKYGTQPMSYLYTYSKEPEAKLQSIQSALGNENIYYDKLGRVHKIDLAPLTKEFAYLKKGNYTSNLVSKINFSTNNVINDNLTYKYDEKGNITEVRQYNKLLARYKYDSLSRIIREDNKEFNTSTTFEYDAGGNILCKKVYAFTIIDNLDFEEPLQNIPYAYPISGWRDQLLSYNNESFEYDNLGNPTKYRDKVLQWSYGRQLDKFADIATYTYNANGIRTSKTYYTDKSCQCESETNTCTCQDSDCFTTKFFLNGNKIIKQHDCCNDLTFYYGADGLTGFHIKSTNAVYNNENLDHDFFYKKNLQGDIIGIIDCNGNEIVKYVYDAWGNHKALDAKTNESLDISRFESYTNTGNIVQFIAIKNPFRYRSYYYDFETGLYYLNSRYYDPELGRFINADDIGAIDVTKITTNGLNLYAYCLSNPVNDKDSNGYIVSWLLAIIIGAVIGGLVSTAFEVANQVNTHGWSMSSWNWGQIGLSFLGGAVAGAISSLPIPGFTSLGIWGKILHFSLTAIVGGTGAVVGGIINGSVSDMNSAITTFVIGASFNLLSEVITIGLNKLAQKIANKTLQNPLFADMTLEDLIGSGLKEYPKSLSSLMSKLSKAIQFANGGLSRSILYMLGISSVMEILSGLIQ